LLRKSDVDRQCARNKGIERVSTPTGQLRLKMCAFTLCFFRWSLSSIG
jgi:hypothetical protein